MLLGALVIVACGSDSSSNGKSESVKAPSEKAPASSSNAAIESGDEFPACTSELQDTILQNKAFSENDYFICDGGKWRTATAFEYDTYLWSSGTDGEIRKGSVHSENSYVYDRTAWRMATDVEVALGGCTEEIADSVAFTTKPITSARKGTGG